MLASDIAHDQQENAVVALWPLGEVYVVGAKRMGTGVIGLMKGYVIDELFS